MLSDPDYANPQRLTRPHYRPVRRTYRAVRANAIRYTGRPVSKE